MPKATVSAPSLVAAMIDQSLLDALTGEITRRLRIDRVGVASAAGHLFEVSLHIRAGGSTARRLSLPAWIPGSYLIRDFARHIVAIGAEMHGESVSLTKLDKQTWELAPTAGPVEVRYQVYAFDLSVRSAYLDATRAYFNGSSLLLRLHGAEGDPCELELVRPPADQGCGQGWTVETTLPAVAVDGAGFGRYAARDYWALIDHPVQCALHRAVEFEVQGVPHRAALSGRVEHCDLDRLAVAPARGAEPGALIARDRLRQLLFSNQQQVQLRFDRERHDRYGRLLAHAFIADGRNLTELLLAEGAGAQLVVPPNTWQADCYRAAADTARGSRRGVWALPSHQTRPVETLDLHSEGFHVVSGRVTHVSESASAIWVNLAGNFALRIEREDLPQFQGFDLDALPGGVQRLAQQLQEIDELAEHKRLVAVGSQFLGQTPTGNPHQEQCRLHAPPEVRAKLR